MTTIVLTVAAILAAALVVFAVYDLSRPGGRRRLILRGGRDRGAR